MVIAMEKSKRYQISAMCSEGPDWSEGTSCCERYLEAGDFLDGDFSELKDGIYEYLNLEYEYLGTLVQLWG